MASCRPLQQRRFGNANVIYLTLSMRVAVRLLSVYLTAWLTAAAGFPPCCWSMANDHDHHPQPASVDAAAPSHEHHRGHMPDGATTSSSGTVIRQDVRQQCDAAPADAIATSTASRVTSRNTHSGSCSRSYGAALAPQVRSSSGPLTVRCPSRCCVSESPSHLIHLFLESDGWPEGQHYVPRSASCPGVVPVRSADLRSAGNRARRSART